MDKQDSFWLKLRRSALWHNIIRSVPADPAIIKTHLSIKTWDHSDYETLSHLLNAIPEDFKNSELSIKSYLNAQAGYQSLTEKFPLS